MITKLESNRTGEIAIILKETENSCTIRKADGTEKKLSASTVKRWWKRIQVEEDPETEVVVDQEPKKVEEKGRIIKKSELKGEHPMKAKKIEYAQARQPMLQALEHYAYKEYLTVEKKKAYIGLYYGDRRVAELRPTKKGLRVAVHPKVVESLSDEDLKKIVVQPKSYQVYFNVIQYIVSVEDLDFAKKLIQLSKAKVLKTYKG